MKRTERSTRGERRLAQRAVRTQIKKSDALPSHNLQTIDQLLGKEEDLGIWSQTLEGYKIVSRYTDACKRLGILFQTAQVPDDIARDYFGEDPEKVVQAGSYVGRFLSTKPAIWARFQGESSAIKRTKVHYSNQEFAELWKLVEDPEISLLDTLAQISIYASEARDLTQMNVDWLRKRALDAKKALKNKPDISQGTSQEQPAELNGSLPEIYPLDLGGRELFATQRRWSTDPKDLVPVSTADITETLIDINRRFGDQMTIKPISVANALVFSLRSDVIDRVNRSRLKLLPNYIREWTRIPRGNDQVVSKEVIDENNHDRKQLIFFVTQGEVVIKDARKK